MRLRDRYLTVEVKVLAGTSGTQVNFPIIPEMQSDSDNDIVTTSVSIVSAAAVPNTYAGNAVATDDEIANGFLTLYVLGVEKIFRIPLVYFKNVASMTSGYYYAQELFEVDPLRVDWTKSYVQFGIPPNNEDQFSYLFTFGYLKLPPQAYSTYLKNQWAQWQNGIFKNM